MGFLRSGSIWRAQSISIFHCESENFESRIPRAAIAMDFLCDLLGRSAAGGEPTREKGPGPPKKKEEDKENEKPKGENIISAGNIFADAKPINEADQSMLSTKREAKAPKSSKAPVEAAQDLTAHAADWIEDSVAEHTPSGTIQSQLAPTTTSTGSQTMPLEDGHSIPDPEPDAKDKAGELEDIATPLLELLADPSNVDAKLIDPKGGITFINLADYHSTRWREELKDIKNTTAQHALINLHKSSIDADELTRTRFVQVGDSKYDAMQKIAKTSLRSNMYSKSVRQG